MKRENLSLEQKILQMPSNSNLIVVYNQQGEKVRSYSTFEFVAEAKKAALFLRQRGIKKGDIVCSLLDNSFESMVLVAGSVLNGNIYAPLNIKDSIKSLRYKLGVLRPKLVIYDEFHETKISDEFNPIPRSQFIRERAAIDATAEEYRATHRKEDAVLILWSSGTTGTPKPIAHTPRMIFNGAQNIVDAFNITSEFNMLVSQSLSACGGLGFYFWPSIFKGARMVLQQGWNYNSMLKIIKQERINYMETVPEIARFIVEKYKTSEQISVAKDALSNLRFLVFGGSRLSKPMYNLLCAGFGLQGRIGASAGETENFLLFALNLGKDINPLSCGKPIKLHKIKIVDELGNCLPCGSVGYIVKQSNSLFREYFNNGRMADGFYKSGDMGYLDDKGYLFIVGRDIHSIKIKGNNYFPLYIDTIVEAQSGVLESVTCFAKNCIFTAYSQEPLHKRGIDISALNKRLCAVYPDLAGLDWHIDKVESLRHFRNSSGKIDTNLVLEHFGGKK